MKKYLILIILNCVVIINAKDENLPRLSNAKGDFITIGNKIIGIGNVRYEKCLPGLSKVLCYVLPDKQPKSKKSYISERYGEYVTLIYSVYDINNNFITTNFIHGFFALQQYQTWSRSIWIADSDNRSKFWKEYYKIK